MNQGGMNMKKKILIQLDISPNTKPTIIQADLNKLLTEIKKKLSKNKLTIVVLDNN